MDNTAHVAELIDQLDDDLDNLQEALKNILSKSLSDVASKYPVLDRAKLYIMVTYAIESAIFSFLRLTGTSAREHPVYRELERVKQYFQKAKLVETSTQKPALRLDQAAAGRFIKAALAGNEVGPAKQAGASVPKPVGSNNESSSQELRNTKKRKLDASSQGNAAPNSSAPTTHHKSNDSADEPSENESQSKVLDTEARSSEQIATTANDIGSTEATTPKKKLKESKESKRARKKQMKAEAKARMQEQATAENEELKDSISAEPSKKKKKKDKSSKKEKSGD